ncbi:dTDP-4-dehydrorhamnose reductase [bacterium]|nr:dTDP-4-dehydrorhamnose reductase [bacterium]
MNIMLIGANGQLGSDLRKVLTTEELIPLTHADIEITDAAQVEAIIKHHQPEVVINTAAYHKTDECEENAEKAFQVNALGVRNLALSCREHNATLVHMSTDYVFDGKKGEPYTELDTPNPINVYGVSKLAGEHFVKYILDKYFLIRTSGLFGVAGSSGKGGNFIELMLRLADERDEIRVVDDQTLSPTSTVDLANKIKKLITTERFGLYHITNNGACSWYDFAAKIFELSGKKPNLKRTTTEEFGAKANRPKYSVLDNYNLRQIGMDDMRTWEEALATYLHSTNRLSLR